MRIYRIAEDCYDKLIDNLMLKGWGVANQLDSNNYARKGWDVAFRVAMAATRKQRDIAIRELRSAAKVLLEELWKLGLITDPHVKKYADELRDVLSWK